MPSGLRGFQKGHKLFHNKSPFVKGFKHKPETIAKMIGRVPWNKGKKFPELRGENSPSWIKDRTLLKIGRSKSYDTQYKYWMLKVKSRDGWKCRLKNSECKGRLEAHHILDWKNYPELRYKTNNGITLCHSHHPRGRENEKRLVSMFTQLVSVSKV